MHSPSIKTTKIVNPKIYAYTTPGVIYHDGWTKIGYTEQEVDSRIGQQTKTADIRYQLEWEGNALFEDTSEVFSDKAFHRYLRKCKIKQGTLLNNKNDDYNEWFEISPNDAKRKFYEFRENHGVLTKLSGVNPYTLRPEQQEAVDKTFNYFTTHQDEEPEFLWNAKPRFGKTLTAYDLVKRLKAKNVLIVTNRPAIANSWYQDYEKFLGTESGYAFVSELESLKGKPLVNSRADYVSSLSTTNLNCIEFVSLQDLKGSKYYFRGKYDKLKEVFSLKWDILVIDEAHEGVDTFRTDEALESIKRKYNLHLSGTPFKALANGKFSSEQIYNYTYADEQQRKLNWSNSDKKNPYKDLPRLNLYTYQMSEIIKDKLKKGIEINGETVEYAFDLNEFFATNDKGKFIHDESVDEFLDALTKQTKYPFSTPELRDEIKHSLWLLNRVDSARALARKLNDHPVFHDYKIILAVGNGSNDPDLESKKTYDQVVEAIKEYPKTITLSVGQLTTGITIPEWTAVLMLSNVKSPALYMQAAFRAQNPCLFREDTKFKRKENAYVFDFDPARTLTIFEEFANDLIPSTSAGRGDTESRKKNIKELLNFFPVVGEDEDGELVELDAEKVLSIPRKIKSLEVVRRGFMSNFLFENINNLFSAPKEIQKIIQTFEPVDEPKNRPTFSDDLKEELHLDENGEVNISDEFVNNQTKEIFGDKVYGNISEQEIKDSVEKDLFTDEHGDPSDEPRTLKSETIEEIINSKNIVENAIQKNSEHYGDKLKKSDKNKIENVLKTKATQIAHKGATSLNVKVNALKQEKHEALINRDKSGKSAQEIEKEYQEKQHKAISEFVIDLTKKLNDFSDEAPKESVKIAEKSVAEREQNEASEAIRDHLRGFSRTIPSFLMAYGDEDITLANFDKRVPDNVFQEVTSITLDQFRLLRDGGTYTDSDTGEEKFFRGKLFCETVFNDSVKEFLSLKKKLADYFDEKSTEDIFDYIPPQRTNQIFTPKTVVKKMVDLLEEENPGCFDNPDKTFADLYMKSGLYIAEIVKRLYQSKKITEKYPDKIQRLKHIFEHQVYGLAPTEIIYQIATNFLLGFDSNVEIKNHNFRKCDVVPLAKNGKLEEKLKELYGDK